MRQLDTISLTQGQETYVLSAIASKGTSAVDTLNITVIWGQTRIPMRWATWTQFNAYFRTWVSNQSRPAVFSNFGVGPSTTFYVQPVPDQTYSAEIDYFYVPEALVDGTSVDELVYPYNDAVQFFAAYRAKFKTQSYGEADLFMQQYKMTAAWAITAGYTRRMPSPYSNGSYG